MLRLSKEFKSVNPLSVCITLGAGLPCITNKVQSCGRLLKELICIYRNKLLSIIFTAYNFFVILGLFLCTKALAAHMWLGPCTKQLVE